MLGLLLLIWREGCRWSCSQKALEWQSSSFIPSVPGNDGRAELHVPGSSCATDQFAATALKPLWQLVATSANTFSPGHSFQLAVADSNVPLLGFILAFNDFYVSFDGVKGIAWECFVWTLVFSALSCWQDLKSYSFRRQGFCPCTLQALPSSVPSVSPLSWAYFTAQFAVERVCLVKTSIRNNPSILTYRSKRNEK